MPFVAVNIVKLLFLAGLYLFLFYVAKAMRGQITGPPSTPQPVRATSQAGARTPPPAARPTLVVHGTDGKRLEYPIEGVLTIGRSAASDVHVDDEFASENHATVSAEAGTLWIEDLGSTNGTRVDDRPIEGRVEVYRGATLGIGRTKMVIR